MNVVDAPFVKQLGQILVEGGPKAVVDAINEADDFFITDTTLRDAHQSILATRLRTNELSMAANLLK